MAPSKQQLLRKLSYLEFAHDQLTMELQYIDVLLRSLGFPCGLESAKLVAQELLEKAENPDFDEETHYKNGEEPPPFSSNF